MFKWQEYAACLITLQQGGISFVLAESITRPRVLAVKIAYKY